MYCYLLKIYSGKISHINPDGFHNLYIIIFPVNICPKFLIGGDGIGDQMFSGYSAFFVVGVGQVSRMALVGLVACQSPFIDDLPVAVEQQGDRVISGCCDQTAELVFVPLVERIFDQNAFLLPHHFLKCQIKFFQGKTVDPVFLLCIVKAKTIPYLLFDYIIRKKRKFRTA